MRLVFAGTPAFAAVALEGLLKQGFEVPLVLTQPDRPSGRGLKFQASPVKQVALANGIPVIQPVSLRLDGPHAVGALEARTALLACAPDVWVVAAYGLLLPPWTLALPRWGCLNIHASLLPRWRGAAPIHRAIEAGDHETGVTIMQMDEGLDTGDMLLSQKLSLELSDTTPVVHDKLAVMGADLLVQVLRHLGDGTVQPLIQPTEGVTYAHKLSKEEAWIDWQLAAEHIDRRVRAFQPAPGTQTLLGGETLKVWAAHPDSKSGSAQVPGTVVAVDTRGLWVQTGQGLLCVTELQMAGAKRLPVDAFLRGRPIPVGTLLARPSPPMGPA